MGKYKRRFQYCYFLMEYSNLEVGLTILKHLLLSDTYTKIFPVLNQDGF